jgi:hypothetical protein
VRMSECLLYYFIIVAIIMVTYMHRLYTCPPLASLQSKITFSNPSSQSDIKH